MTTTARNRDDAEAPKPGWGKRHVTAALLCFAYISTFFSRGDITVAIVAMTSKNSSYPDFPIFNWTETQKNAAISCYFAGLVISSTAAGEIIRIVGAPTLLHTSFIAHAVLSAIVPLITWNGSWLFLSINRALSGFFHGFLDPLAFLISSRWFPPNERNFLLNFVFSGSSIGLSLSSQICGYLGQGPTGWPSIFYLAAVPLLIFSILWKLFGEWSPQECKTIKLEERNYIEQCLANVNEEKKGGKIPWKSILTSLPVYAILVAEVGQGIIIAIAGNEVSLFIDGIHEISVSLNGLLTSIPTLTSLICLNVVGIGADMSVSKKILTIPQLRKISATIALGGSASFILLFGFFGSSLTAIVVLHVLCFMAVSFCYVGFLTNPLDLSPNYSQSIVGLCRAVENIASFATPLAFTAFLTDPHDLASWRFAFTVIVAPVYLCNIFYLIFGRAEAQPWDKKTDVEDEASTQH